MTRRGTSSPRTASRPRTYGASSSTATSAGPGQAPAYKVGQRLWLQLRDEVRAAEGEAFELTSFHRRALDLGAVGLDVLREALLGGLG